MVQEPVVPFHLHYIMIVLYNLIQLDAQDLWHLSKCLMNMIPSFPTGTVQIPNLSSVFCLKTFDNSEDESHTMVDDIKVDTYYTIS